MGKPIAARNKFSFGSSGILVLSAVLKDGTKLNKIHISKQRSNSEFDLLSNDKKTIYPFLKLTGLDKNGVLIPNDATYEEILNLLSPGTFCVKIYKSPTVVAGYARKFLLNKVILEDGSSIYGAYYNNTQRDPSEIAVTGITVQPKTLSIVGNEKSQITATVEPVNASNKNVTWTSSDSRIVKCFPDGSILGQIEGDAIIIAITEDGSFADTCSVRVDNEITLNLNPKVLTTKINTDITADIVMTSNGEPLWGTGLEFNITSSDDSVATAEYMNFSPPNVKVKMTAHKVGVATITVEYPAGKVSDTLTITVTE